MDSPLCSAGQDRRDFICVAVPGVPEGNPTQDPRQPWLEQGESCKSAMVLQGAGEGGPAASSNGSRKDLLFFFLLSVTLCLHNNNKPKQPWLLKLVEKNIPRIGAVFAQAKSTSDFISLQPFRKSEFCTSGKRTSPSNSHSGFSFKEKQSKMFKIFFF